MWIKLNEKSGLVRYSTEEDKLYHMPFRFTKEYFDIDKDHTFSFKDEKDRLWIIPSLNNKAWYNENYTKELPYFSNKNKTKSNIPLSISNSFCDTSNVTWVASAYKGIEKNVELNSSFNFQQCKISSEYIETNDILAILEDSKERLWISTQDNKIRIYDKKHNLIGYLNSNGQIESKECQFANIISIYEDRKGNIWLGGNPGLFKLIPQNNSSSLYQKKQYSKESASV